MLKGKILITGGAGFLGRAIVRRAIAQKWDCSFSILSRDPEKHHQMQVEFPQCRYVIGDICDLNGLSKAFAGHDTVIHAAAQKHIPEGEKDVEETIRVNYYGSRNVARAAIEARVEKVVGISTDKACHPVNVYGASKMMMERLFQEYDRKGLTQYHLVRYGNVIGSTGSVIPVWQKMLERDGFVTATDPHMSRFWMSIDQAVDAVLLSLDELHGTITIPDVAGLSMGEFANYAMPQGTRFRYTGLRLGEKKYEQLVTPQEYPCCMDMMLHGGYRIIPEHQVRDNNLKLGSLKISSTDGLRSDNVRQLTKKELLGMLGVTE